MTIRDMITVGCVSFAVGAIFMFVLLAILLSEKSPRPSEFHGYEGSPRE